MALLQWMLLWLLVEPGASTTPLTPGVPLERRSIRPGEAHFFQIVGLAPSASYEIKLSYPATMPATFEVLWGPQSQTSRRLLNTHKEMFATDGHGQVKVEGQPGTTEFVLLAHRESHSYDPAREQHEAILYNIVPGGRLPPWRCTDPWVSFSGGPKRRGRCVRPSRPPQAVAPVFLGVPTEAFPVVLVGLLLVAAAWGLTPAVTAFIRGPEKAATA